MITDRIGRHEVLLPINHKITISQIIKEGENSHQNTSKGNEKPPTGN